MRIENAGELASRVIELLHDESQLMQMGRAAREVVQENQGALQVTLDQIAAFLPDSAAPPDATAGRLFATLLSSRS